MADCGHRRPDAHDRRGLTFISKKAGDPQYLRYVLPGLLIIILTDVAGGRDVIKEAHEGYERRQWCSCISALRHHLVHRLRGDVLRRLVLGLIDAALYPNEAITYARTQVLGGQWPPILSADTDVAGLGSFKHTFDPGFWPFVNTLILLTSGKPSFR